MAFYSSQIVLNSTNIYGEGEINIVSAFENQQSSLIKGQSLYSSGFTGTLLGSYAYDPITIKLIKLPITTLIQYLNPINIMDFNHKNPWFFLEINLKIIWLMFLGPLSIFTLINSFRVELKYRFIFYVGLAGYIMVAFLHGGLVPRYALCFMVITIVPLAYVFDKIFSNKFYFNYGTFNFIYITLSFLGVCIYILN